MIYEEHYHEYYQIKLSTGHHKANEKAADIGKGGERASVEKCETDIKKRTSG